MIYFENLHNLMIDKMHNIKLVCVFTHVSATSRSLNIIMLLMILIFELDQCSEIHFVDRVSRVQMQSNKADS